MSSDPQVKTVSETDNYAIWTSVDPEEGETYHIDMGNVTLHFFPDEWDEFVELMMQAVR